MRSGGGKAKGAKFEREICRRFSLWVTRDKQGDVFWRSAMSGGRATIAHRKGIDVRQAGDLTAVAREGNEFLEYWYVECKHVANLSLESFLLSNAGLLANFWRVCKREAQKHGRQPMLVCQQNRWRDVLVIVPSGVRGFQIRSYDRGVDICRLDEIVVYKSEHWGR
jgi:hypothetical protein